MTHKQINKILGAVVFLTAFILYFITMSPTVSFWDCGEFIATSFTMGVPHPPGAPIFLVLGRVFTSIPFFEDIGRRMNLVSTISSATTILLLYLIIVRLIREWKPQPDTWSWIDKVSVYGAGVIGAFVFMVSDSFWFNAVEAEVYAISMCLTALVTWLILKWTEQADEPGNERWLLLIAYMFGIATAIHLLNLLAFFFIACIYYFKKYEFSLTTFFVLIGVSILIFFSIYPGIVKYGPSLVSKGWFVSIIVIGGLLYSIYWTQVNRHKLMNLALLSVLMIGLGYASYAVIYIRANVDPPINENDPSTSEKMYSYLNREQYGDSPIFPRRWSDDPQHQQEYRKYKSDWDYFWSYQVNHMFNRYFAWNFVGKSSDVQDSDYDISKYWMLPFILGMIGMVHHFSRDWKRGISVFALFFLTGYAIILYLNQTSPQPRERDYSYVGAFFAFAIWIGIGANFFIEYIKDSIKGEGIQKILVPITIALLIVFIPGRMLAVNFHEHDRSGNYVAYDYARNILAGLEPNAVLFTNGDNDTFPLWYQQEVERYRTDVRIVNLSLLNTDWYIKQLKNNTPREAQKVSLPSNMTDDIITGIGPMQWAPEGRVIDIPVNKVNVTESDLGKTVDHLQIQDTISWKMDPTIRVRDYSLIRVQDFMIYNIIRANEWRRPIYFAITVPEYNRIGIDNYLRLEGLVYRLVPSKGGNPFDTIEEETMRSNLFEKYWYRNLNDENVYYDENIRRLVINYRNLFLRLSYSYFERRDSLTAASVVDKMQEMIPAKVFPYDDARTLVSISEIYKVMPNYQQKYFEVLADAEEIIKTQMQSQNADPSNFMLLEKIYAGTKRYQEAIGILEQLLVRYPNEPELTRRIDNYKKLMQTSQPQAPAAPGK